MDHLQEDVPSRIETVSEYAYQQVRRVFSNRRDEIEEQLMNELPEVSKKLDSIINNWDQDKEVKKLIDTYDRLHNSTDKDQDTANEIDEKRSDLVSKLDRSDKFKEGLRQGGLLGELVGIHLLSRTVSDQDLLKEPLVILGIDSTIDYLNREQESDEKFKETDRYREGGQDLKDFHESIIRGSKETVDELSQFRERIKNIQFT